MGRGIDVYQLIQSFAHRNNLSEIDYKTFAQALQRQARLSDQSEPVFRDLVLNPDIVLVPRLFLLSKEKKLLLQTSGNEIRSILLPEHFAEAFLQEYRRMDDSPDVPFPDEDSLKLAVPGEWIQSVPLDTDLGILSDRASESAADGLVVADRPLSVGNPEQDYRPVPLFRITFPDGVRPLVVPSSFIPGKMLEYSVLKLRHYLRKGANKEYLYNKLVNAFPGKENQLKEAIGTLLTKPYDVVQGIERSVSDFTFPFWAYFVSVVKKDFDKRSEKTPEDWSYLQSAILCEFYVNHYKGKAQRQQDLEAAMKAFDVDIRQAPYYFTLDQILSFRDAKGVQMLSSFGKDGLEGTIRDKSTKAEDGTLPELLVVSTGGKRYYVTKDRVLLLAVRFIAEARSELRSRLIDHWKRLLADFRSIPAMDGDTAFLAELFSQVESRFPLLEVLIRDRLLPLVRDEVSARGELPAGVGRLFYKDDLVPLDELLGLSRKTLLVDAKMLLPFWYTVPILSALARLLHRLMRSRDEKASSRAQTAKDALEEAQVKGKRAKGARALTAKERRAEFEEAANRIARDLLPKGYGIEEYLRELEGQWNTLLNPEAKKNLCYDVDSLVRDYLRGILRNMGGSGFTTDRVRNLGSSLADSPNLLKIKNHKALELYIQLYMVKVLGARVQPE
jgi:hypothetical protein